MSASIKNVASVLHTTPSDRKNFPATNQAHYCWQKYNEYVLCMKKTEGDDAACKLARNMAVAICPAEWTTTWDEQRENGTFLGVQEKAAEHDNHH